MSDVTISVENLSKKYRLGTANSPSYRRLSEALTGLPRMAWNTLFSPRAAALAAGGLSSSSLTPASEFWALRDINFEIKQGEVVGIIGRNGAGKSTLLKILSRISEPTSGRFGLRGRVASLLEVGTGFHPELTGRENIYVSGVTLGMSRREITRSFDEIVDFSGVEKFLETPVKYYSSGMQVRLGFAVAAHLNSEILIIDEVLAVGDAEFQKKCMGKLEATSRSGRTVFLVSHQIGTILYLCSTALCLEQGRLKHAGNCKEVVNHYKSHLEASQSGCYSPERVSRLSDVRIAQVQCQSLEGQITGSFNHNESFDIVINCDVFRKLASAVVRVLLSDSMGRIVFVSDSPLQFKQSTQTGITAVARIPANFLRPGMYHLGFFIIVPNVAVVDGASDLLTLSIVDAGSEYSASEGVDYGCVFGPCEWSHR